MYGDSYKHYNYGNSAGYNDWSALPAAAQGLLVGLMVILSVIVIALVVMQIVGMWKTFKKAGQKGWEAIIPFYNTFILIKIAGLELWWFIALSMTSLIVASRDVVSFSVNSSGVLTLGAFNTWAWALSLGSLALIFAVNYKIAKSYDKTLGFAVGLTLLPPIFWMILGFSQNIKYIGPDGPYEIKYPTAPKKKI